MIVIVGVQVLAFSFIFPLSYVVHFDGAVPPKAVKIMLVALPWVVGIKLIVFLCLGAHRGWWRYNSFADMVRLTKCTSLSSLIVIVADRFHGTDALIPLSVVLIDWAGTVFLVGGLRGAIRIWRERYFPMFASRDLLRVLIVGASEAGASLIHQIHSQPRLGVRVVGILDPDRRVWGWILEGVRVLGSPDEVKRHILREKVDVVLAIASNVAALGIQDLVAACSGTTAKVRVVPEFESILSGDPSIPARDVELSDLLRREPVQLDNRSIGDFLRSRVILVTGAAGSIGSEICRQVLAFQPRMLILLDHWENGLFFLERDLLAMADGAEIVTRVASITDRARLRSILEEFRPAVILHAAAYKHVPMMEVNPGEAVKCIVLGTQILIDEAVRTGVEALVMTSTDKAVNPASIMGACKRLAEMYVQALSDQTIATRLVAVRFGNVLGSNGSVVPLFQEQIRKGNQVVVTHHDMTRFFMTIPEATQLVLQAGALGQSGETLVLDMGKPVRILDLARDLIRLSNLSEGRDVEIVFTGPRLGEKLHEELYNQDEECLPTSHPRIFRVRHRACSISWLKVELDRLIRIADEPKDRVFAALKRLVPEYRPSRLGAVSESQEADEILLALLGEESGGSRGHTKAVLRKVEGADESVEEVAESSE